MGFFPHFSLLSYFENIELAYEITHTSLSLPPLPCHC
jgi:hypothetical protein